MAGLDLGQHTFVVVVSSGVAYSKLTHVSLLSTATQPVALASAFSAFLYSRTLARLPSSTMSATDR